MTSWLAKPMSNLFYVTFIAVQIHCTSGLSECLSTKFYRHHQATKRNSTVIWQKSCWKQRKFSMKWILIYGIFFALFFFYWSIVALLIYSIFFIDLYWSIIASQYCVSFCCTTKWISHMHTYTPHPLTFKPPFHPPYSTPLGKCKAPRWSPCAMWLLPTS